jgi:hypothetical protein
MALPLRRSFNNEGVREKLNSAWSRTDEIFAIVASGQLNANPIVWRHPFIFYIGHLPAFSWNQICGAILNWKSFNPYFDDLFCRGIAVCAVSKVFALYQKLPRLLAGFFRRQAFCFKGGILGHCG